jgi:uncharacterized protein (TIGR02217 family)
VPAALDQEIGTGNGKRTEFALAKVYRSGGESYRRPIAKPVDGSVRVAVDGVVLNDGVGFSVDPATGVVDLVAAPASGVRVTAGFEFDVPVRFDTDRISTSLSGFAAGEIPSIPVVEVKV